VKFVHLVAFIIKKFVTMHSHVNEKFLIYIAYRESFQCIAMAPEVVSLDFSV